jgi:hypothetical protein
MGNRSKLAGSAAIVAGSVALKTVRRRRRKARFEPAAYGIAEAIVPTVGDDQELRDPAIADEAHAPGHRHLAPTRFEADQPEPERLKSRPWRKHFHGLRHPGRL